MFDQPHAKNGFAKLFTVFWQQVDKHTGFHENPQIFVV